MELLDSIVGQRGKSLNFFTNDVVLLLEYDSYDKKSASVVMWKDKEYEYISSA